ncbi:hypothetical protein ACNF42_01675 [Cuniculiplasma sp. SKW3]|uniref:hypothetical protein n=1 Tax=unclassified Cuniculiplasma TaxID=2619706 RepID=UPI003FD0A9C8
MRHFTKGITLLVLILFIMSLAIPASNTVEKTMHVNSVSTSGSVVFNAINLPPDYNFSVDIDKKVYVSSYDVLEISLPLGSYNYSIVLPFKFLANKTSGQVEINKGTTDIYFKVTPRGSDTYELLAISILISVLSILIFLLAYIKYMRVEK